MGWKQEELAKRLGVAGPDVSRALGGKHTIGIDKLLKWARALQTTPQALLGTAEEVTTREPGPGDILMAVMKGLEIDAEKKQAIELILSEDKFFSDLIRPAMGVWISMGAARDEGETSAG